MKTRHFLKTIFAMGLLAVMAVGCEPLEEPVVEELNVPRVFMPTDLSARIRSVTSIELDWFVREDAESYVVEFAEGENDFSNIVRTVEVAPEDVPIREDNFAGETFYSIRVKGVSQGVQDSNWATVTIQTDPEQIFYPLADCDVQATEAYLAWPPGSAVTHFIINPGNINRPITEAEMTSGMATLTGLSGDTDYTVTLYNNNAVRGFLEFTTLTNAGTLVETTDDLSAVIAAAADGDVLLLSPGEHNMVTGELIIDKSLSIRGLSPCDKPVLSVSFTMAPGLQDLELKDLELVGNADLSTMIEMSNPGNFNSININGCFIHDYGRQLIYGNTSGALLNNFIVDNSIITDFIGGGGDFIDFRSGDVHNIALTNSTFVYTPSGRDFIRADASGDTNGTGVTLTILVDHCTLVHVGDATRRITYVRFENNDITISNNLFANTTARYSSSSGTDEEMTFINNNYFEAPNMYDPGQARYDNSDSYFTLDPGFADPDNRDYTVTNPDVRDENIGDPRWLN